MPTANERSLIGRLGALALHATHDSREVTEPARAAFRARFLDQTDAALPMPERLKRADQLLRLHMARMALKSAQARRKRAATRRPWRYDESGDVNVTLDEEQTG